MRQPKIPKYPFRRVGSAERQSAKTIKSLAREAYASGQGKPKYKPAKQYLDREKNIAVTERPVHGIKPPKWLLARFARHASIKVVINDLFERLRRAPSKRTILFTQYGLNEIGRRRGGGRLLRQTITQSLVDKFQAKGGK